MAQHGNEYAMEIVPYFPLYVEFLLASNLDKVCNDAQLSIPFIPPKILSLLIVTVFDKKYKPFILKKRKNCQTIIIK
ncbi:Uncharacterised protein [Streptococcus pneumoniae]|nr:Uncharacterised protein [Streptococcus pneumoniae]CIW21095.1 Uncharacterised protein [Streptococcus pneumoniae]